MAGKGRISKEMLDAFNEGVSNPNAPLSPGEARLLAAHVGPRVGPRVVFIEEPEEPGTVQLGELTHVPFDGNSEDIVDAELIED